MGIPLYEHNQSAYEAAIAMLTRTGKAAVIHPTGTGKSFIGFQLCAEHPDTKVCWLSPSDYIFQTQIENIKQVCGGDCPENIQFFTYAKLMNLSPSELREIQPGYIILDEFHRCGAELWGKGVQRLLKLYQNVPVLGLSATNIRYLDNQRDMADELFDGNVASSISLGEAVVRGILNPPKYVLSIYSYRKELKRYEDMVARARSKPVRDTAEVYLNALRRAIEKADGLDEIFRKHMAEPHGKYIVFCSGKAHMDEMMACAGEWFAKVDPKPRMYSLYSEDAFASKSFRDFKDDENDDHLRLLFTINALNEGIHVSDISGVILLRPTISPIVYKQQIGRALSTGKGKNAVIFDIVMNIENLHSIGGIQAEMEDVLRYYAAEGREEEIVNERFQVIDEVRSCVELFEKLNETLSASWDYMYGEAAKYFETHSDLNVPSRYITENGYSLGAWLTTQRQVRNGSCAGTLTEEQIKKLDRIGMRWLSTADMQWEKYYAAARDYYGQRGDLEIPVNFVTDDGLLLGKWISNLRSRRKEGSDPQFLTEERMMELAQIGMVWDQRDEQWQRSFSAAQTYFECHGDLNVPLGYVTEDGFRLGQWLNLLRSRRNREASFPEERVQMLNAIGMQWESKSLRLWELGFAELETYARDYGTVNVPRSYVTASGYKLGSWVEDQREKYRSGKMKKDRVERLEQLGMTWKKEDPWELRYALAKKYYEEHHNLNVPAKYVAEGVWLNKWLNEQKQIYLGKRKGKMLTVDQIARLDALGITWPEQTPIMA